MEYVITPDELVTRLITMINTANIDGQGDKVWTQEIKKALRSILEVHNREVIFTEREKQISEFMLDIVVWDRKNGEGIVLAAESEWPGVNRTAESYPTEVVNDFYKLLVVKSAIKLMIFASSGERYPQKLILDAITKAFESYKHHVEGERYIFIDFAPNEARKAFWLEVPLVSNGRVKSMSRIVTDLRF